MGQHRKTPLSEAPPAGIVTLDPKRRRKLAEVASDVNSSPSELLTQAVDRLYQSHVTRKGRSKKNDANNL